jgi:hypothetical protein
MSDQPGIPAIMVFPPFNPAPRQAEPAPVRDQAPAQEEAPPAPPEPRGWDVESPPEAAPWDFAAPAADEPRAAGAAAAPDAEDAGRDEGGRAAPLSEEEDLPWLEVPEPPRAHAPDEPAELKADDAPNWMEWVRDEGQAPPAAEAEEATPIGDLAPDDAQPWAPETETAADDWAAPSEAAGDPWEAPSAAAEPDPWQAPAQETPSAGGETEPGTDLDLPEPELYDLPDVAPSAAPWTEAEAPLFQAPSGGEAGAEAEPAWELPSQAAPDAPPAWESFAPAAAEPEAAAPANAATGPFAAVADRLQEIADALRTDPGAFLAGARGGGDPLGLLVAGFVMGYNARQGGGS